MAQLVDHGALRTNQAGIIATVLVAFAASAVIWPAVWLIPLLALILLAGTVRPEWALFKQLYFHVLRPRGLVRARPAEDNPSAHNFAQSMGGVVLAVASLLLPLAAPAGLALALLVAALAFVNLAFGFCAGCQIYYLLGRRGLIRT
jgi:Domain of unknown function (DUF4395)